MKDGNYLFRETPSRWWRATVVADNSATAGWICGSIPTPNLDGEWHGPLTGDSAEWQEATSDTMGRLLRKFEP